MTNEEIVCAIKAGDEALYPELWERVKRLIFRRALSFYNSRRDFCASHGVTADDLAQSGYFALVEAVKAYRPESGYRFTTFLNFHLKLQFQAALDGGRRRNAQDMLNYCGSLDEPAGENEDGNILDCILDPGSEFLYEEIDSRITKEGLRDEMESCLNAIKPARAEALRFIFYDQNTLQEAGERIGRTRERIRQLRNLGLADLRKPGVLKRLRRYRENPDV